MKKRLCVLLICGLLLGCHEQATHVKNDVAEAEAPIRIVESAVALTAAPTNTPTPMPTATATPVPTDTPAPTHTPVPTGNDVPGRTAVPTEKPAPTVSLEGLSQGEKICEIARQYLGYAYERGGNSPEEGFDPGGFAYWCMKEAGLQVRHKTSAGYSEVEDWDKLESLSDLVPGDLVFFKTGDNENINCVCIYLGEKQMIYPSSSRGEVIVTDISNYWINAFQFARRPF